MLKCLGKHFLIELVNCDEEILKDQEQVRKFLLEAAIQAKATIVEQIFHCFSPYGVSGVVVIAESHISIHTWPEHNYAAVDVFTCNLSLNVDLITSYISKAFKSQDNRVIIVDRGVFSNE